MCLPVSYCASLPRVTVKDPVADRRLPLVPHDLVPLHLVVVALAVEVPLVVEAVAGVGEVVTRF